MRLGSLHQTVLLQAHDERKIKYGHANIYCSICHLLLFYILTPYLSSQHFFVGINIHRTFFVGALN